MPRSRIPYYECAIGVSIASLLVVKYVSDIVFLSVILIAWLIHIRQKASSVLEAEWISNTPSIHYFIVSIFLLPFAGLLIAQLFQGRFSLSEYESVFRIALGAILFRFISRGKIHIDLSRLCLYISLGSSIAIIFTALSFDPLRTEAANYRFSNYKHWPNDLGAYVGIFTTWTFVGLLLALTSSGRRYKCFNWIIAVYSFALVVGLILLLWTGSRGPWLATIFGLTISTIQIGIGRCLSVFQRVWKPVFAGILVVGIFVNYLGVVERTKQTQTEYQVFAQSLFMDQSTSVGSRVAMMLTGYDLITHRLLYGYGTGKFREEGCTDDYKQRNRLYSRELCNSDVGPHNELVARGLQAGILGVIPFVLLLLAPVCLLNTRDWICLGRKGKSNALAYFGGFSVNILVLSLFMEPFSLKYSATFNTFMFASFLGICYRQKSTLLRSHGHRAASGN